MVTLYDKHGHISLPDLSTLSAEERERIAPVVAATEAVTTAEKALQVAHDDIALAVERLDAAERAEAGFRLSPSDAFHKLWKENVSRPDRNR